MCRGKTLPCHDWITAIIAEGRGLLRRWVLPVLLAQRGNSRGQNLPWNQHTKEGHESNTSGAGSNCSFLLKRFVRLLKRSAARGVRAFSSTAVAGACSSNPGLQGGFFFFSLDKTHVHRKLLYCTSPGRRGKQPNQWGGGRLRSLSSPRKHDALLRLCPVSRFQNNTNFYKKPPQRHDVIFCSGWPQQWLQPVNTQPGQQTNWLVKIRPRLKLQRTSKPLRFHRESLEGLLD